MKFSNLKEFAHNAFQKNLPRLGQNRLQSFILKLFLKVFSYAIKTTFDEFMLNKAHNELIFKFVFYSLLITWASQLTSSTALVHNALQKLGGLMMNLKNFFSFSKKKTRDELRVEKVVTCASFKAFFYGTEKTVKKLFKY